MRLAWIVAGIMGFAGVVGGLWSAAAWTSLPGSNFILEIAPLAAGETWDAEVPEGGASTSDPVNRRAMPAMAAQPSGDAAWFNLQPSVPPAWQATVSAGDTLDGLLRQAGLKANNRAKITLAVATQFDLTKLRPGHRLIVQKLATGQPIKATLEIDDGVRIVTLLNANPQAKIILPETETTERGVTLTILTA